MNEIYSTIYRLRGDIVYRMISNHIESYRIISNDIEYTEISPPGRSGNPILELDTSAKSAALSNYKKGLNPRADKHKT